MKYLPLPLAGVALTVVLAAAPMTTGHAYQLPADVDVTAATVTKTSGPRVVTVERTVANLASYGQPEQLAYTFEMTPTVPSSGNCTLLRDGFEISDGSCTFTKPFFEDALEDASSGDYQLRVDGRAFSSWTFARPVTGSLKPLTGSGCRVTPKLAKKASKATRSKDPFGDPVTTYTYRILKGTFAGKKKVCRTTQWSAGVGYRFAGTGVGGTSATLTASKTRLSKVTFSLRKDVNSAEVTINGTTPRWRANIVRTLPVAGL